MEWEHLLLEIERKFQFLNKITVTDKSTTPVNLHSLIKFFAGLLIDATFNNNSKRLALLFPKNFNIDKWLSILSVLNSLNIDFNKNKNKVLNFKCGQKLLFNNKYIVEFDKIDNGQIWVFTLNKKSNSKTRIGLNANRILEFQSLDIDKKLSIDQKVWQENKIALESTLDKILGIYTTGNKSFFENNIIYVGLMGKSESFIQTYFINNIQVENLFLWGKLSIKGKIKPLFKVELENPPSCLIAKDIYSVVQYLNHNQNKTKAVFISQLKFCKKDPHYFNVLLDSNIPVIITAEYTDLFNFDILYQNDFKIWHLHKNAVKTFLSINPDAKKSIYDPLHEAFTNFYSCTITPVICEYHEIETIVHELISFERKIQTQEDEIKELFSESFRLFNEYVRLVREASPQWKSKMTDRILIIQSEIMKQKMWISEEIFNKFNDIFLLYIRIINTPVSTSNTKINILENLIKEEWINEKLIIILPKTSETEETQIFWQKKLHSNINQNNRLKFISAGNYLTGQTIIDFHPDKVIVCGWLGNIKMFKILHNCMVANVTILLYPHEKVWYENTFYQWQRMFDINDHKNDIFEIIQKTTGKFNIEPDELPGQESSTFKSNDKLYEMELRLTQYRYSKYTSINIEYNNIEKVKYVAFNNEKFAFFTLSHKNLIVNELVHSGKRTKEIRKKTVENLNYGDYILFFESDKDLIREFADRALEKAGKKDFRKISSIWQKALKIIFSNNNNDIQKLIEVLKANGCRRHPSTIKNWLANPNIIAPEDIHDVEIILKVAQLSKVSCYLNKIKKIISGIRSAHHQASSFLTKRLMEKLPEILSKTNELPDQLDLSIQDFGNITILRVEDTGTELIEVEKSNVNRLLN